MTNHNNENQSASDAAGYVSQPPGLEPGTLYLVATPIGNLADLTFRALSVLRHVDAILAEDTRHSKKLFAHYGIRPKVLSALHEHNEAQVLNRCITRLQRGETMALVSDAGTPLISDPGYLLVKACVEAQISVCPVPGPCAFVAALSVAGLPTQDVRFMGFLPAKQGARRARLTDLVSAPSLLGFYEAPHRLTNTLVDMIAIFGQSRQAVLSHDISKRFESHIRGTLADCLAQLTETPPRGEWVIWVMGYEPPVIADADADADLIPADAQALLSRLKSHMPPKQVAAIVAEHCGVKKNACYAWLVSQRDEN